MTHEKEGFWTYVGFAALLAAFLPGTLTITIPLLILYLINAAINSSSPARQARRQHRHELKLERENTRRQIAIQKQRTREEKAKQRLELERLRLLPPPRTAEQKRQGLIQDMPGIMASIDEMGLDEDTKRAMKNAQLEELGRKLRDA